MTQSIVIDPNNQAAPLEDKPVIPDKFQGKTAEQLVEMYQNLESTNGRMANEIGHLRKFTDSALGFAREAVKPANQVQAPKPQVTSEDLLANPHETVTNLAKQVADDRVLATERRTANLEAQLAVDRFARKYPDFEQTMGDTGFQEWISGSAYRQKLAGAAAQRGDFDAADELFGLYNASKAEKPKNDDSPASGIEAARKASLTKKGGSSAAGVAKTSSDGKKIYSRHELIEMRINDEEGYNSRYLTEYLPAYKEGRVR